MAPGHIAVGLAVREMRAAKPGDHKYQSDHCAQGHFSLDQWCVATRLSFLKDTHRTCGVVTGIGFLVFLCHDGKESGGKNWVEL